MWSSSSHIARGHQVNTQAPAIRPIRTEQHPKSAPNVLPIAVSSLREGRTRQGVADPTFTHHTDGLTNFSTFSGRPNPPTPCASKRVEAPTGQQTLQTLENKLPRGRVSLPLPPPSGPARLLAAGSRFLAAPLTLQKCFKNQHFFNISAFWPHQAPTYTPHSPK